MPYSMCLIFFSLLDSGQTFLARMLSLPLHPMEGHSLSTTGESEFDHVLKAEATRLLQRKEIFSLCNQSSLERHFRLCEYPAIPAANKMFKPRFLTTTDDPCLNQSLPWWLQNTDCLNLSHFLP